MGRFALWTTHFVVSNLPCEYSGTRDARNRQRGSMSLQKKLVSNYYNIAANCESETPCLKSGTFARSLLQFSGTSFLQP